MVLPQRWRIIMATDKDKGFPEKAAFQKYGGLVRSMCCNNLQYYMGYLVPYVNQLTELEVADLTDETLPLLNSSLGSLTCIRFRRELALRKQPFQIMEFLKAIHSCHQLETLRLEDFVVDGDFESEDDYEERRRICNRDRKRPPVAPPVSLPNSIATVTAAAVVATGTGTGIGATSMTDLITLSRSEEEKKEAIAIFYQILQRVKTMYIVTNVINTPPPNRSEVFYRLRKLVLLGSTMNYMDQFQLVSQCQYLTHLKLQFNRDTERLDLEKLTTMQLQVNCPNIIHLDISWSTLKDEEIAALLNQLPRLVSIRAQRTKIGERTMEVLAGITSGIRSQLTELDLVDAQDMKSAWVQQILCSCVGLKRFWATEIHAWEITMMPTPREVGETSTVVEGTVEGEDDVTEDIPAKTTTNTTAADLGWVCLELKELQLSITGISSKSSLEEQIRIYTQLSKLTKLQVLSLGGNFMSTWFRMFTLELSLEKGFGILKTLKDLRIFNFSYMSHDLGMNEVEFMMENWPRLRRIIGTIGTKVHDVDMAESVLGRGEVEKDTQSSAMNLRNNRAGKPKIERHELYIHRKWPLLQFSSK
ncbi:hypothetical protein BGZ76_005521 [Entomortierella beljakovae]|nr:hypothetical protein BGZ76_005521 [Entomortierella beljakovae]